MAGEHGEAGEQVVEGGSEGAVKGKNKTGGKLIVNKVKPKSQEHSGSHTQVHLSAEATGTGDLQPSLSGRSRP